LSPSSWRRTLTISLSRQPQFLMCVTLRTLVVTYVSDRLKDICSILGRLSDRLTSLEGKSEFSVSASRARAQTSGTVRDSEKPTGTDAARGGRLLDSARGESETDSDGQ
jgi:hypothetical protein